MDLYTIRALLGAWARWHHDHPRDGVSIACPLAWIWDDRGGSVPSSRIPSGVIEPPDDVAEVMKAMATIERFGRRHAQAIQVVRAVYLRTQKATLDEVAAALGIARQTLDSQRYLAETALLGWFAAKALDR